MKAGHKNGLLFLFYIKYTDVRDVRHRVTHNHGKFLPGQMSSLEFLSPNLCYLDKNH